MLTIIGIASLDTCCCLSMNYFYGVSPPFKVTVTRIVKLAEDVRSFFIARPGEEPIVYEAGQFLTFIFNRHGREERRSFSLSSAPNLNEPVQFAVKRIDNGAYSRLLVDKVREGDELVTSGAGGRFIIPQDVANSASQIFFFAAGIGITPVISQIKTLLHQYLDIPLTLVYSNRNRESTVYYNELTALAARFAGRFRIEFLFSEAFDLSRARLSKSLMPTLLLEYGVGDRSKMLFYACGPFSYMRMVRIGLEEMGFNAAQIRQENFNVNAPKPHIVPEPPIKTDCRLTLQLPGRDTTIMVAYPDTVLQAAKKSGLILPYSCEAGRCGSCAAMCTGGKLWMSYNEVLTTADLQQGMILTCVAHPITTEVTLRL